MKTHALAIIKMKTYLNSIQITKNEIVALNDVTQLVINNYSAQTVEFTIKNITREIQAFDAASGIPGSWGVTGEGNHFDIEFEIVFSGSGKVIVDYLKIKNC